MNLLITGLNGFVGGNLVAKFKDHHTIYGLDIVAPQKEGVYKTFDWNELDRIPAVEVIIHLAGLAHDVNNTKLEKDYYHVNTELTKTIFNFFLTSSAQTFIYFSTVKAVCDFSDIPLVETVIAEPSTIYGKSKRKAEEYILNNLPYDGRLVYILRPCMIHGPQPKGNLVSLYNYFRRGFPYPLANFSNNRSYLSINNLIFILERILVSKMESGIYHVSDDEPLSTNEIIEMIGEVINKKPLMINLPKWMIKTMGHLGTVFHLPVNDGAVKKLTSNYLVSNCKLKKALNIELPMSAKEGMLLTLKNLAK